MRRFIDDESGMTMGLVVIVVVLIGVMGAGLLTFVSRSLNSVVEVNQGQRAQEVADAGFEAAKRQLAIVDAMPSSYDATNTGDNSEWYDDSTPKTVTFNGNQIQVGIRYLRPSDPGTQETQARESDRAPEALPSYSSNGNPDPCNDSNGDGVDDDFDPATGNVDACDYPNNRNYFRVTVRGGTGDAVRVLQAIYQTDNFNIPVAYYATRDIEFNSSNSLSVDGLSLFANRNIINFRADRLTGTDQAYGDWATIPGSGAPNPYNATRRTDALGNPVTAAGVAAIGSIDYKSGDKVERYGYRDYDANSASVPGRPNFVSSVEYGGPPSEITFPFATGNTAADNELLTTLKEKAQSQGRYVRLSPESTFTIDESGGDLPNYPASSELTETVMFIEFASGTDDTPVYGAKGTVTYKARSSDADNKVKGIIVVMHGDLNTNSSSDPFQGTMIVRDGRDDNNAESDIMKFDNGGNVNIEGFINVEGDIKLGGTTDGFLPAEMATGLPGLFRVSLWSWRECYSVNCS
jgi:hypothetical protein